MIKLKSLLLKEALTVRDAEQIFKQFGVPNPMLLSPSDLKQARNQLILKQHPDKHPPEKREEQDVKTRLVNAAYDVLKLQAGEPQEPRQRERNRYNTYGRPGYAEPYDNPNYECWAQAGWSGGAPNWSGGSERVGNLNYYKKKAWEISGKPPCTPDNEYTFWNWDGYFFRGVFSVFATPSKLYEISHMMIEWDDFPSAAVFYTKKTDPHNTITLINRKGQKVFPANANTFEHESFNNNPGNDQSFVNFLRQHFPR